MKKCRIFIPLYSRIWKSLGFDIEYPVMMFYSKRKSLFLFVDFFLNNWVALLLGLLGFFDLIARLIPTEKDNSIVNFLMTLFNAIIPNLKKGGGSLKLLSK
jgi:hypothetical protein